MNNRVIDSVYIASGVSIYSNPIDMQGDTFLAVAATCLSGTGTGTVTVEGSYDLQTWSNTSITQGLTSIAAAPSFQNGVAYNFLYKYARIKIVGVTAGIVVTVSCGTFNAMTNRVLDSVYIAVSGIVYSNPIDMQGDNSLAIAATGVTGTGVGTVLVEGSYDLQTWSSTNITQGLTSIAAAPSFQADVTYNILYKYARIKITGGSAATVVNVCCGTFSDR